MRRGRYAPSPTGVLHLGNLRTALLAWLFARSSSRIFTLRIEDLDRPRARPGATSRMLADLRWLGLDWDEGPDMGGPLGPYFQSQREAVSSTPVIAHAQSWRASPAPRSRKGRASMRRAILEPAAT
jgi:glutamyl/glutaminyl-tRNA synthetase